jgi:ribosomal protein S18 acetylase RimI-like enzyme
VDEITIRSAVAADVEPMVRMLADDQLGATRDSPEDLEPYLRAFREIDADPNQLLVVADSGGRPVGMLQLSIIPGLSRGGAKRGQIEGVRVHSSHRGTGLGTTLLEWAIAESRRRDCALVQLTSDTSRSAAHRFYERLGFEATHTGFKLRLY